MKRSRNSALPFIKNIKKILLSLSLLLLLIQFNLILREIHRISEIKVVIPAFQKVVHKKAEPIIKNKVLAYSCTAYVETIEKYPWDTSMVLKIASAESKCNPNAVNRTDNHKVCMGSYNILQVGCLHYKEGQDRKDVETNVRIAYQVYKDAGNSFRPWTTCRKISGCK